MAFVFDNSKEDVSENFSYDGEITNDNLCIIIDMQEGFRDLQTELIVSNIHYLLENFKSDFVFTQFVNEKGSLFETQLDWTKFQNEDDINLMHEFDDYERNVFKHNKYSIFTKELDSLIKKNNYKRIYLCGVYTDVSIKYAAMEGFDKGYKMFVVDDACNSLHGKDIHDSSIGSLKHILGSKNVLGTKSL